MRKGRRALWAAGLAGVAFASAACRGYVSQSLVPASVRRIHVPIFANDTFYRQIELDLTRQVAEELRRKPGVYVTDREEADVVLEGRITDVEQRVLSLGRDRRRTESSATTRVRLRLVDARSGEELKAFTVSERVDFATATGEGLATAQREAYFDLARKIVQELEADW